METSTDPYRHIKLMLLLIETDWYSYNDEITEEIVKFLLYLPLYSFIFKHEEMIMLREVAEYTQLPEDIERSISKYI